jgi:beta-glucosidase
MGAVMPEPEYDLPLNVKGETAIYVLARISGEGNDREAREGDIFLTESERRTILELKRQYRRFMLVLNVGGPVDLSPVMEVENILILSQLGVQTGSALADLVLGKTYPSGKLTTTWTKWKDYPDFASFGEQDDTRYQEGIYVGYRYFDSVDKEVLFPFGYGVSYTNFEVRFKGLKLDKMTAEIGAEVVNIGDFCGKEVVQLYVSVPEGKLDQPYQTLASWKKTEELKPGEKQTVELSFLLTDLASYDEEQAAWILEQGEYTLRMGNSSRDTEVCGVISVPETLVIKSVKNCFGKPDFTDWKPERKRKDRVGKKIQSLEADIFSVDIVKVVYEHKDEPMPEMEGFSDEELISLNVGAFVAGGGVTGIIGNASMSVAGAAGETAKVGEIPVIVMADGPAGLRLSQKCFRDENGIHSLGSTMPETMQNLLTEDERAYMNSMIPQPGEDSEIFEQYATAIPIGTAIAQSWNPLLAERCGDIVGSEMERFGIHLWLAPALNIHRSIRCGRNYEYFSEDPLISGVFAAALTKGVQSHPGCGVTIKHFAANNQETNRYNNNSIVSERALREIYLKGFEICVRLAQPKALMTSYNLLNGKHTSEHRELLEDVLRCEFEFDGIVMTDWVTSSDILSADAKYPAPEAYKVALAGNDLFMPGSQQEIDNLTAALKNGHITREELIKNATRICRMAVELAGASV